MASVRLRISNLELFRADLRTRIPFRYGIATMIDVPHVFLRVTVETPSGASIGISADHLPPKWFTKDPARALDDEIDEMLAVIRSACSLARGAEAESVFSLWRNLYDSQAKVAAERGWPPLLAHFGVTLIERAAIEAVARAAEVPFHRALRDGTLGFVPGEIRESLEHCRVDRLLPSKLPAQVIARHTIGLVDPLTEAEVPAAERVNDGLPQTLEAAIRAYGLRHFKIKVSGSGSEDVLRLERVLGVIEETATDRFAFSLDGNEGFKSVAAFRDFWSEISNRPWWIAVRSRLLFVEQPWHRSVALSDEVGAALAEWPERPPLIIDESDADLASLPRALQIGYDGTSHKNCKGVFKGAANACLLAQKERAGSTRRPVMSGEDLSNVAPVALLQDLAVQAALGIGSVERNGHHYFAGLSFWPKAVQDELAKKHSDLFTRDGSSWPRLDIRDGAVSVGSISAAPFGRAGTLDLSAFETVGLG